MMDARHFGANEHPESWMQEQRAQGVRLTPGFPAPFQIRRSSTAMLFYFVRERRCA